MKLWLKRNLSSINLFLFYKCITTKKRIVYGNLNLVFFTNTAELLKYCPKVVYKEPNSGTIRSLIVGL